MGVDNLLGTLRDFQARNSNWHVGFADSNDQYKSYDLAAHLKAEYQFRP